MKHWLTCPAAHIASIIDYCWSDHWFSQLVSITSNCCICDLLFQSSTIIFVDTIMAGPGEKHLLRRVRLGQVISTIVHAYFHFKFNDLPKQSGEWKFPFYKYLYVYICLRMSVAMFFPKRGLRIIVDCSAQCVCACVVVEFHQWQRLATRGLWRVLCAFIGRVGIVRMWGYLCCIGTHSEYERWSVNNEQFTTACPIKMYCMCALLFCRVTEL